MVISKYFSCHHALSAYQGKLTRGLQTELLDGVCTASLVGLILVLRTEYT